MHLFSACFYSKLLTWININAHSTCDVATNACRLRTVSATIVNCSTLTCQHESEQNMRHSVAGCYTWTGTAEVVTNCCYFSLRKRARRWEVDWTTTHHQSSTAPFSRSSSAAISRTRRTDRLHFSQRRKRHCVAANNQALTSHEQWHLTIHSLLCWPTYLSRYSDSLRTAWSGDRIPVKARFSAPVQTGPGAHPTSYTTGTGSLSRG